MHRILGAYLIGVASMQLVLYFSTLLGGSSSLIYLDPRLGLFFLETVVRQHEVYPGLLSWLSAIILAVLGIQVRKSPTRVRRYLVVETAMALPTVLMALVVTAANLSPAHGFSVRELVTPLAVLVVATLVPFGLAWKIRTTLANTPPQPTSGAVGPS